jgi:hypothetical protein
MRVYRRRRHIRFLYALYRQQLQHKVHEEHSKGDIDWQPLREMYIPATLIFSTM